MTVVGGGSTPDAGLELEGRLDSRDDEIPVEIRRNQCEWGVLGVPVRDCSPFSCLNRASPLILPALAPL